MTIGNVNYIGAISSNNGIRQKIDVVPMYDGNCITVNYNGSVGEAFYQDEPFWASDDVNVLFLKNHILNRRLGLFFATIISAKKNQFAYTQKWTMDRMKATKISIPVNATNGEIDFNFIDNFVRAQEKLAIKGVVDWKETFTTTKKGSIS